MLACLCVSRKDQREREPQGKHRRKGRYFARLRKSRAMGHFQEKDSLVQGSRVLTDYRPYFKNLKG